MKIIFFMVKYNENFLHHCDKKERILLYGENAENEVRR
jgi:hypothetical protein